MFSNFGFSPEIYIRGQHRNLFDQLLYMYVESGLPVVAALSGHSHTVTIIGHLSDYTIPPSTPVSSDAYLSGFIANDDNFLPYHAIRMSGPAPTTGYWSRFKAEEIDAFIVPLYEKIHLSAEHIVELAEAILTDADLGVNARSTLLQHGSIVTRAFLTSSKSFKKVRRGDSIPFGIANVYCEMAMPKFIWVCEISTPDLFREGKISGEILFDSTANPLDSFAFLSIHYPDFLLLNDRDFLTDDQKRFKFGRIDTNEIIPYYCYVNNLCEV